MLGTCQSLTLIPPEGKSRRGYRIKRILLTPKNEKPIPSEGDGLCQYEASFVGAASWKFLQGLICQGVEVRLIL
jgi:hypothetical protein